MSKLKIGSNLIFLIILLLTYPILYKIYSPRVNAFGCFDDCFNFVAGYFILKGKMLYSEIFFNHQPLMAHISYLIQFLTSPINIYELILRHRQFVFLFGFVMNFLIVLRFNLAGLGFFLFYEFSKFYLFGDRFLAEGVIVYPLVYMAGLVFYKLQKKKIYFFEFIIAAIFTWLVAVARTPFIPLAIFQFTLILWKGPSNKAKKISIIVALLLTLATLLSLPIKDYLFNIINVNIKTILAYEIKASSFFGIGVVKIFLYPIYLFFDGEVHIFRIYILGLDLVFLTALFLTWQSERKLKTVLIIFLLLGLANLRLVKPGRIFFDAFHLIAWYGIFILFTFLMVLQLYNYRRKTALSFFAVLGLVFFFFVASPQTFINEKIDTHSEFINNFGKELQVGEVVQKLSEPTDTLFLDGFDDLIYWQANRLSSYKYSWYTSVMPKIKRFSRARLEMFEKNLPDFYYGTCPNNKNKDWSMPKAYRKEYQQLYSIGKPTCLYVHKEKIRQISKEKWIKAKQSLYELPN